MTICYRLDGSPFAKIRPDDGDWVPCDPAASVSTCCSVKDYCMGNGLCLDAGANNYFSIQGCTDQAWGQNCITRPECRDNLRDGYSFVWPCGQVSNSSYNYCCGASPACCGNKTSLIVIEAVTSISKPTASTVSIPSTAPTITVVSGASSSETPSSGSDGKTTLAIGLGVGVFFGLLLIGALLFNAMQMRKSRKARAESVLPSPTNVMDKSPLEAAEYTVMPTNPTRDQQHQSVFVSGPVYSELESPYPNRGSWSNQGHEGQRHPVGNRRSINAWYGGASPSSHP